MKVTLRRLLTGVTATIRNPNAHSPPLPPIPYHHVHRHLSFLSSLPSLYLNHRLFSSSPTENLIPTNPFRTRTPLEKQFETWVQKLKPRFGPPEVNEALKAQSDPDLALDIFRKLLFNHVFYVYKKMLNYENCKLNLETYALLLNSLLRRFNNMHVCYVYLRAVRSLAKQMKACGVIPDTFVLNMIIKAYSKCLQPNAYTYGYITKGLCEKGRVAQGLGFYKEMRGKRLVPSSSTFMIVICSLTMGQKYDDAIEVVLDMLSNAMSHDLLTYKTLLEGLCQDGKDVEAFDLLEDLRRKNDGMMNERTYKTLLNALHFVNRE
ncbi:unnamed protein product [Malus baccata var. baccata]